MDRLGTLRRIAEDAGRSELTFPTSADVLLRIRKELEDPDCEIASAVRLIQAEPLLSAKVVSVSNSVTYNRAGRTITDVRAGVNVLGFRTVRTLATAMVVRQLAGEPDSPAHRNLATQLWEHSAHVAALAHLLARRVTGHDPETAMFAGTVHEVGGFYLLSRVKEFPGLLEGVASDWTGEGRSGISAQKELGRVVLTALAVPQPVVDAIEVQWNGYLAFPPTTMGDTLLLADQLASVKSPLFQTVIENPDEMAAALDMIVEENTLSHILKESADEVKSLTAALRL